MRPRCVVWIRRIPRLNKCRIDTAEIMICIISLRAENSLTCGQEPCGPVRIMLRYESTVPFHRPSCGWFVDDLGLFWRNRGRFAVVLITVVPTRTYQSMAFDGLQYVSNLFLRSDAWTRKVAFYTVNQGTNCNELMPTLFWSFYWTCRDDVE